MPAFGSYRSAFLLHLLIDKSKHLKGGYTLRRLKCGTIPDRATVGGIDFQPGAFADQHHVVKCFQIAVSGQTGPTGATTTYWRDALAGA
jgi:hypothetical protein